MKNKLLLAFLSSGILFPTLANSAGLEMQPEPTTIAVSSASSSGPREAAVGGKDTRGILEKSPKPKYCFLLTNFFARLYRGNSKIIPEETSEAETVQLPAEAEKRRKKADEEIKNYLEKFMRKKSEPQVYLLSGKKVENRIKKIDEGKYRLSLNLENKECSIDLICGNKADNDYFQIIFLNSETPELVPEFLDDTVVCNLVLKQDIPHFARPYDFFHPEKLKEMQILDDPIARLLNIAANIPILIKKSYIDHSSYVKIPDFVEIVQKAKEIHSDILKQELNGLYGAFFEKFMDYFSEEDQIEHDERRLNGTSSENLFKLPLTEEYMQKISKFASVKIDKISDNRFLQVPKAYTGIAIAYSLALQLVHDEQYKELKHSTLYKATLSIIKEYMNIVLAIHKTLHNSSRSLEDAILLEKCYQLDSARFEYRGFPLKVVQEYNKNLKNVAKKYNLPEPNILSFQDLEKLAESLHQKIDAVLINI